MEENNIQNNEEKKNNLALYIIVIGIIVLIGIGTGYFLYKNNNGKIINNTSNANEGENEIANESKWFSCNWVEDCNDTFGNINIKAGTSIDEGVKLIINGNDVSNKIDRMAIYGYLISKDLVFVESGDTSGGTKKLFVFNSKGNVLYSVDVFENGLFYIILLYFQKRLKHQQ